MTRAIKPKVVSNIQYWILNTVKDKTYYTVGSKELDRYIKVREDLLAVIMQAVSFLDGTNSLEEIEYVFMTEYKSKVNMSVIYDKLANAGLIEGMDSKVINSEISILGNDILNIKFKTFPKKIILPVRKFVKITFVVSIIIVIIALIQVTITFDKCIFVIKQSFIYDDSYILGAIFVALSAIIGLMIHEMGHWLVAVSYGLQPSEFHLTMYTGLLPIWYFKINGLYTLTTRKRVAVMAAGMITNLTIVCLLFIIVLKVEMNILYVQIIAKIIYSLFFNMLFSLMPIGLTDGYFILSWLSGITNLRIRVIRVIKSMFTREKFKVEGIIYVYFSLNLVLIMFSIYNGVYWNLHIIKELWGYIRIDSLMYMIIVLVLMFYLVNIYKVSKKVINYIKEK